MFADISIVMFCVLVVVWPSLAGSHVHHLVRRQSAPSNVNICELPPDASLYCSCNRYSIKDVESITCFVRLATIDRADYVWPLFSELVQNKYVKISALSNNTLTYVPTQALQRMPALSTLDLSGLNLTTLGKQSISNLSRLTNLDLTDCRITEVEVDALATLPVLEKASIQRANFSTLRKIFTKLPMIKELFLEENGIKTIEDGVFSELGTLDYLSLHGNQIESIQPATFRGLGSLLTLEITNNRLKKLDANLFSETKSLQKLYLEDNQIKTIDVAAFQGLKELDYIKLQRNKLSSLPGPGLFAGLTELSFVDLSSNQFTHLSGEVFYQPNRNAKGNYIRLSFRGNNIYCSCSIFWLQEALNDFDSITKQEMKSIECLESSRPDQGQSKQSLIEYINKPEIVTKCAPIARLPKIADKNKDGNSANDGDETADISDDHGEKDIDSNEIAHAGIGRTSASHAVTTSGALSFLAVLVLLVH